MVLQNIYVPQHHWSALGSSKISECEWLIRMATNSSYFRKFPAKPQTSQYRSKSPASWDQMEILQWSKLSIKSPCLWACHWACTCPHAEFWAILKVTHYFSSLFFPSNLQLNCLPCYHHHQDLATTFLIHTYLLLLLNVQKQQQQQLLFLLLFLVCF